VDVTTQHNDMQRTGAAAAEATLTRANVAGLHKVSELVVAAVGLPDGTQKDLLGHAAISW